MALESNSSGRNFAPLSEYSVLGCCRWVVPALWGPAVLFCLLESLLAAHDNWTVSLLLVAAGVLQWQLLEYCIHRYTLVSLPDLSQVLLGVL